MSFLPSGKPDREHLERTIACIRRHRDTHSTWPTWANVLADEVERLWAQEAQTQRALVEALARAAAGEKGNEHQT